MAKYKIPYPGLTESLKHLKTQVVHSLPYTAKYLPRFETPEQVFNYCKSKYHFKSDPRGVELFQTVPTLLEDNYHDEPGAGDCDDATIFCLSLLLINGFNCGYVLAGRNKNLPTHIYAYVDQNGQKKNLDLTNKNFDQIRPYPFKQFIPFNIPKNQLKMFLELADGRPRAYKIKRLSPAQKQNGAFFFPSKNVHIPYETIDRLPRHIAKNTLLSEGYDEEQLSEYLSGRAERKQRKAYRAEKKQIKLEKKRANVEKKQAKTEIKKARAQKKASAGRAKEVRAEAKRLKAERGESGGGAKLFNRTGEFIKNVFQPEQEEETEEVSPEETEQEIETSPEEVETEETDESELSASGSNDLLSIGAFAIGFFLEKTKRV